MEKRLWPRAEGCTFFKEEKCTSLFNDRTSRKAHLPRGARGRPCGPRARPRERGSLGPALRMSRCPPAPGRKGLARTSKAVCQGRGSGRRGKRNRSQPLAAAPEEREAGRGALPREPLPWSWSDNTGRESAQSREAGRAVARGWAAGSASWGGIAAGRASPPACVRARERAAGCLQTPPAGNLALRLCHEAARPLSAGLERQVGQAWRGRRVGRSGALPRPAPAAKATRLWHG